MSKIVLLDLFSGIGGFALGLQQAGFQLSKHYYSEIDPYAIANYQFNFKNSIYAGPIEDIQKESIEKPDIVCFGSPCQDLSIAGKRRGIKGRRSRLFFEAIRILELYKPSAFIFENVRGLFSSNQGKDFEIVLKTFADLGVYDVQWQLLNTSWFLPQNRERIYLVGSFRDRTRPQVFPIGESPQKDKNGVKKSLSKANITPTLFTRPTDTSMMTNPFILTTRRRSNHTGGIRVEFRENNHTNCITQSGNDNLVCSPWKPLKRERSERGKRIRKKYQKRGSDYTPFGKKQYSLRDDAKTGTITTTALKENLLLGSNSLRVLTPIECERLQGFPDDWTRYGRQDGNQIELSDSRRYQGLGNAVSVPVVKAVAQKIMNSNLFKVKTSSKQDEELGRTPISYYGGKQKLVSTILPLIPHHNLYCEPFLGGAAIFFAKEPSPVEVINDLNGEVVNFYQMCKLEFTKLKKLIEATPHSRKLHSEAAQILKSDLEKNKVRRAWAFWVQTNMSFTSKMFGGYAYEKKTNKTTKTISNKKARFTSEICDRLSLVDIECNDALRVILSRDTKDSFFYVDPPYFNSNMGHYDGYTEENFIELLEVLSKIKGKFLLSSYPSEILEKYKTKRRWHQISIEQRISASRVKDGKKKTEVLTANYPIQHSLNGLEESNISSLVLRSKALGWQLALTG